MLENAACKDAHRALHVLNMPLLIYHLSFDVVGWGIKLKTVAGMLFHACPIRTSDVRD